MGSLKMLPVLEELKGRIQTEQAAPGVTPEQRREFRVALRNVIVNHMNGRQQDYPENEQRFGLKTHSAALSFLTQTIVPAVRTNVDHETDETGVLSIFLQIF